MKRAAVAEFDAVASAHSMVLRAKPEIALPEFLPFFMMSEVFWTKAIEISVGSLSPTINWKTLAKQEFLLPPKEQQAKLAELLWAADGMIEAQNESAGKVDRLIRADIKAFFQGEFSEYIKLKDVGSWLSGGTPSRKNEAFWDGDIPWLSPKDMKAEYLGGSIEKITQAAVNSGAKLLPVNSLLVVVRGLILAHSFPVGLNTVPAAFNQDMRALVTNEEFLPELILYFLQHKKNEVLEMTTTTTHGTKRLASDVFLGLSVPKPPIDTQKSFVQRIKELKATESNLSSTVVHGRLLLKSLINEIFSQPA